MRLWIALLLALLSGTATAATAIVKSGEHPGFTRIVIQFETAAAWQFGRTLDGYALRVAKERPIYDLTKSFDLIGRSRLAAIWADPKSGDLHLGIACACYAMPFEFRPGIVVVDLHDGSPPKGASFELPLAEADPVPDLPRVSVAPAPVYNWAARAVEEMGLRPGMPVESANSRPQSDNLVTFDPSLEPLRLSLLEQMSRGASQGIVDMTLPKSQAADVLTETPSVEVHLGETPEIVVRQKGDAAESLTAQGERCIEDKLLDIGHWGSDQPVSDQIGPERQGLTGEFDKPDSVAVARTIRFHLYLGFGAEARAIARSFGSLQPDAAVWESMALLLDDLPDPAPAFAGMEDCDTAAALWAILDSPDAHPAGEVGKSAVMRTFSALPPHLRRLLGPRLVDRFLAAQDTSAATALREAILRAPGDPGPEIRLTEAKFARATGNAADAEAKLQPLVHSSGPVSQDALATLVEQRVSDGQSVSYDQVLALEEALKEREGGVDAPRFERALILARAGSGDFDGAFESVDRAPETLKTIWQVLAVSGPDSAFLTHAVLAEGEPPPLVAQGSAGIIADRLLGLGLPEQAQLWLSLDETVPALLRARVELALGDPEAALSVLQGDDSDAALDVVAAAKSELGRGKEAAELYGRIGKDEAKWSALSRSEAWDSLATDGPDIWKNLATVVEPPVQAAEPPSAGAGLLQDGVLARNKALVDDSAATRDAIGALLATVKSPRAPAP